MRKYVVLKNYNTNLLPDVVGQFETNEEAVMFANLSHKTDSSRTYSVAVITVTTSEQ